MNKNFQLLILLILTAGFAAFPKADEKSVPDPGSSPQADDTIPDTVTTPDADVKDNRVKVEFDLIDREGKRATQEDFLGKYVLLTFGYTHCEHICPVIVSSMARTLKASNNGSVGIFISVDTERDTPAIADDYAEGFNKDITGLSGTYADVSAAANNFKVSYSVTKTQKHYVVQHSTDIFLIGPEGRLLNTYTFNSLPQSLN